MAPAIGIDLGTSYSCVGVYKPDGVEIIADCQGIRTIPSYVAFTETERLIGEAAKNQVARNPRNTVFDVKRLIGRKYNDPSVQEDMRRWPFTVKADSNGKAVIELEVKGKKRIFHPEEISAMILGKMKKIAEAHIGQEVSEAVITVPAYFNQAQRQATKVAGRIAGLKEIHLFNEPSAAALAYGLQRKKDKADETNVLIFDLGGGTLDVSLVNIHEGVIEVKATAGDTHLGGGDFDNHLVDYCVQDITERHGIDLSTNARAVRRLRTACESAKRTLSSDTKVSIDIDGLLDGKDYSITITRDRFEELCISDFGKCLRPIDQVLRDAGIKRSQLGKILLVGGSTCIPMIQQLIREFIPKGREHGFLSHLEEAVAYGAAVQAATCTCDNAKLKGVSVLDVNPLSLGWRTSSGVFSKIIERNTKILKEQKEGFVTRHDNQTEILLQFLEGEEPMAADNNLIVKFKYNGIPPAPRGVAEILLNFWFDRDGMFNVSVPEKTRGGDELTVTKEDNCLTQNEIDHMVEEAEKLQAEDEANRMRLEARNGVEALICEIKINLIKECDDFQSWLKSNPQADKAAYDAKHKEAKDVFNPILMKLPKAVIANEGGTGDSGTDSSSGPTV